MTNDAAEPEHEAVEACARWWAERLFGDRPEAARVQEALTEAIRERLALLHLNKILPFLPGTLVPIQGRLVSEVLHTLGLPVPDTVNNSLVSITEGRVIAVTAPEPGERNVSPQVLWTSSRSLSQWRARLFPVGVTVDFRELCVLSEDALLRRPAPLVTLSHTGVTVTFGSVCSAWLEDTRDSKVLCASGYYDPSGLRDAQGVGLLLSDPTFETVSPVIKEREDGVAVFTHWSLGRVYASPQDASAPVWRGAEFYDAPFVPAAPIPPK